MSYLLQDDEGQIIEPHSISAGYNIGYLISFEDSSYLFNLITEMPPHLLDYVAWITLEWDLSTAS